MAISKDDIKRLAELSRLELTDEEVTKMQTDVDAVIEYVNALQEVELPDVPDGTVYFNEVNVMRDDDEPLPAGEFTEKLLAQAPRSEGRYLKVKKILGEK